VVFFANCNWEAYFNKKNTSKLLEKSMLRRRF